MIDMWAHLRDPDDSGTPLKIKTPKQFAAAWRERQNLQDRIQMLEREIGILRGRERVLTMHIDDRIAHMKATEQARATKRES